MTLEVLNATGHSTLVAEAEDVQVEFDRLIGEGYAPFEIDKAGLGTQVIRFPREARHILMVPPRVGG